MSFNIFDDFEIPASWKPIKLKDLADFNKEGWKKSNQPEHIHYIDIKSVSTGTMEKPTYMSFSEAPSRARRIVNDGDIIISTVRPNLKQFTIIEDRNEANLTASTGFCTIRAKDEKFKWFIYAIITSDFFTSYLERTAEGAAYPAFKPIDISESTVALPPEDELETISNIVKSLYRKKAVNNSMNATLEKIAQRIFKSWFVDFDPVKANAEGVPFDGLSPEIQALFPNELEESELGMIPKGWEVKEIQDIAKFQNGYAFKSKELSHDKNENSISVFKMGNILKGGGFKREGSKDYYEYVSGTKIDKYLAKKGDLLMSMTDMKANVALLGHTALMPVDDEYLVNQRVGHIKVSDNSYLNYPFLYLYTNSSDFIHEIRSKANSGVQVNLSTKVIKESKVVVPPKNIHEEFNKVAIACFEKLFLNESMNNNLSKIRDKLLPRLISGKITIQKAEELLEEAS